jgi:hypothetical protein
MSPEGVTLTEELNWLTGGRVNPLGRKVSGKGHSGLADVTAHQAHVAGGLS